jgi:hypothetical protein
MILLAKSAHLVLEIPLGMMLPLAVDIPHQRAEVCGPNREQSVSALPRESDNTLLLHPCGRCRFDLGNNLCRGARRSKPERQMYMVFNASHTKALAIELARRTCQIGMKGRPNLCGDQRLPLFRAEYDMDQIQTQRLRHGSPDVSGLQPSTLCTTSASPRPSAWAVMCSGLRPLFFHGQKAQAFCGAFFTDF